MFLNSTNKYIDSIFNGGNMLQTTGTILDKLGDYSSPRCRLQRLVDKGEYIYLKRGLYEDDPSVPGQALASAIYGPSYLSFDYALYHYGIIPETVFEYTSATCGKNRTKRFKNSFGRYSYRDVPAAVFSEGVVKLDDGYYAPGWPLPRRHCVTSSTRSDRSPRRFRWRTPCSKTFV